MDSNSLHKNYYRMWPTNSDENLAPESNTFNNYPVTTNDNGLPRNCIQPNVLYEEGTTQRYNTQQYDTNNDGNMNQKPYPVNEYQVTTNPNHLLTNSMEYYAQSNEMTTAGYMWPRPNEDNVAPVSYVHHELLSTTNSISPNTQWSTGTVNDDHFMGHPIPVICSQRIEVIDHVRPQETFNQRFHRTPGVNCYVTNLDTDIDESYLHLVFMQVGYVVSTRIMKKHGLSEGYGYVCFSSPKDATKAVVQMNGRVLGTKPIVVKISRPRKKPTKPHAQVASRWDIPHRPDEAPIHSYTQSESYGYSVDPPRITTLPQAHINQNIGEQNDRRNGHNTRNNYL